MAITYPLALPDTTSFQRLNISAENVVGISQSPFTLSSQTQSHQGNRWRAGITLKPMKRSIAESWLSFLLSLNGMEGTFLLFDPAAPTPRGIATGTPLVDGASQTGKTLATKGWTAAQTGILLAGDYISLGTGENTRLYKVMQDANSDGGGLASLEIWPRLRESPSDGATITLTEAKGTFRLAGNIQGWDVSVAQFYGIGFDAVESF